MSRRTIITLTASAFLMIILELVSALANVWSALLSAALLPLLALGAARFFEIDAGDLVLFAIPCISSLIGAAVVYLAVRPDPLLLFPAAVAAIVAALIVLIRRMSSKRCQLCNARIGGAIAFVCPRCGLLVCEERCWSFEYLRCRLCEQNRVPVLPPDGRWWDKQLGPRSPYGHCQLCLTEAANADLRVCGKCGRPQCRDCWDFSNGQCSRCQWTIQDLPESLRPFALPATPQKSARR